MKIQNITNMVLNRMRKCERVVYFDPGDGYIWVSPDGFAAYRIPAGEVKFNLNKCESNEKLMDLVQEEGHVFGRLTGKLQYTDFTHKEIVTEIQSESLPDVSVWINEKYLKPFESPVFLIKDGASPVLVCDISDIEPSGTIAPYKIWKGEV